MFDETLSGTFNEFALSFPSRQPVIQRQTNQEYQKGIQKSLNLINSYNNNILFSSRPEWTESDLFAPITPIWDLLLNIWQCHIHQLLICQSIEQLLSFRGRCSFRIYIPNKPAKYGIMVVLVCHSSMKCIINARP